MMMLCIVPLLAVQAAAAAAAGSTWVVRLPAAALHSRPSLLALPDSKDAADEVTALMLGGRAVSRMWVDHGMVPPGPHSTMYLQLGQQLLFVELTSRHTFFCSLTLRLACIVRGIRLKVSVDRTPQVSR
jgi:hypothetical protein